MTLWPILTIMTAVAAVFLSVPIIRRFDRPATALAGDIEVYRDQLKEVESELGQGLIDDAQAETARVEIKRRVLAAGSMEKPVLPTLSPAERNFGMICVTVIVVFGSVGLYALTGNPDLPSVNRAGATQRVRAASVGDSSAVESLAALMQLPASENEGPPQARTGLPPVDEMIQRLAARLLRNPKDAEGWRTLGWSYLNIGRFAEAAEAYAKAIELSPGVAEIRSARIEALVRSENGVVMAEAKTAIADTLKLDPRDARARFFNGLAKEQAGDRITALADWSALLEDAGSDEPWLPDLKNRISELQREIGNDATGRSAGSNSAIAGGILEIPKEQERAPSSRAIERGPSREDAQAAEAMPQGDRLAMIRGMVDGLANRLEQSPRDADGWIKLIRSRMVLGETDLAKQALEHGLKTFTDDTQQRDRIIAAARQLGLNQE
jgi:cytochrome c-type biogenesis protein CcmH